MSEPYSTDDDLVAGLKAGEQFAQLTFVKRFGPRMKALIKAMPWSWRMTDEDIKEVLNDATHKIIEKIAYFNPANGEFRQWAFKITVNQGLDWIRASNTGQRGFEGEFESYDQIVETTGKELPSPSQGESESGSTVARLSRAHIIARQALARLTTAEQQVLKEHMYGLANPEIAHLLRKSEGSVRTALSRARTHLRAECLRICAERNIDPRELQC